MIFPFSTQELALRLLLTAGVLAVTFAIQFVYGKIVIRTLGKRNRSAAYEIGRVGSVIIWVAGILSILPLLGASDTVVAVVILLVGAFLILATRDFSSNWFAGQTLKALAPFKVGDWIRVSGSYGRVAKIDGLYTTLVTLTNETVMIPNSKLTSELLVDRTTSGSIKVPIELDVDRNVEFGRLTLAITEISSELGKYLAEQEYLKRSEPEIYVVSHERDRVRIRVILRISNPAREEELISEFRKRFAPLGLSPDYGPEQGPERLEASTRQ
jgi:small-conductance mechanosensitive channel